MSDQIRELLLVLTAAVALALIGGVLAAVGHRTRRVPLTATGAALVFAGGLTVLAWAIIDSFYEKLDTEAVAVAK